MQKEQEYRQILKSTSLFGGVQIIGIIIGIIRSKIVAILLGPLGMGITGLYSSSLGMISSLTNFGLSTSAIKDISAASSSGDTEKLSITATTIKRLVWITGILGTIITICLSAVLSEIAFGNREYTIGFILISITLLINQISSGQGIILRGLMKLKWIAKSGIYGSIFGLIVTLPLYFMYGLKGIVPGIILTSICSLLITWYFSSKIHLRSIYLSWNETFTEGKEMLKMGFLISLSGLLTLGASYIVRIFISNNGSIDHVGLYNAGFAIVNTYVGMIFTAMSTDFFPRLSGQVSDSVKANEIVNYQAEIALLLLSPIVMFFLVFINWIIIILYSNKFILINDMILWAGIGLIFKAVSWPIGYLILANGASKIFFWSELVANLYMAIINIVGYKLFGLEGLGISFLLSNIILLIQVYIISIKYFKFSFTKPFAKLFIFNSILAIICFVIVKLSPSPYSYIIGSLLISISLFFAYKELDSRMRLTSALRKLLK